MEVRAAMAPQDNLEGMSFPRLKALAAARGVDVSDLREKAELVAALGAAAWREAALTAALKCLPADATARAAGRSAAHAAAHAAFLRRRRGEASSDEDDTTAVVAAATAAAEAAASVHPKIQEAVAEALVVRARALRPAPKHPTRPWKCYVCTLPFGTCEHTRKWFALQASQARTEREAKLAAATNEAALSVFDVRSWRLGRRFLPSGGRGATAKVPASRPPPATVPRARGLPSASETPSPSGPGSPPRSMVNA